MIVQIDRAKVIVVEENWCGVNSRGMIFFEENYWVLLLPITHKVFSLVVHLQKDFKINVVEEEHGMWVCNVFNSNLNKKSLKIV